MDENKPTGWHTGIVHLGHLPDKTWLELEEIFRKNLIFTLKKEIEYLSEFAEEIEEPIHYAKQGRYISKNAYSLRNFICGKCISLRLLRKLSIFLTSKKYKEFELLNVEKYIKFIKAGKNGKPVFNPKFPLNLNSADGGRFIAAILCDGCIDINQTSSYRNESFELRNNVIDAAKNVFGDFETDVSKSQIRLPTIISKILIYGIGMSFGKKTVNNVSIPDFILKSRSKTIIKNFLQQAFDDEGSVTGKINRAKHVTLELSVDVSECETPEKHVPNLLIDVMNLLKKLEISNRGPYFSGEHVCKDGRIKNAWSIYIGGIKNLRRFSERISFSSTIKSRKLENAIIQIEGSLKRRQQPRKDIIRKIVKMEEKYGKITSKQLNKDYNIKLSTASSWLTRLEDEGKIKKVYQSWKPRESRRIFVLNKSRFTKLFKRWH